MDIFIILFMVNTIKEGIGQKGAISKGFSLHFEIDIPCLPLLGLIQCHRHLLFKFFGQKGQVLKDPFFHFPGDIPKSLQAAAIAGFFAILFKNILHPLIHGNDAVMKDALVGIVDDLGFIGNIR